MFTTLREMKSSLRSKEEKTMVMVFNVIMHGLNLPCKALSIKKKGQSYGVYSLRGGVNKIGEITPKGIFVENTKIDFSPIANAWVRELFI